MAIVYERLLALKIPDVERRYTERDPIFYALSLGLGQDPVNTDELPFCYEGNTKIFPTFPVVAAQPGFWARELDTGIDWVKVVHGEHDLVLHEPMPARATVTSHTRVIEVIDKGPGKGALVISQRTLNDKATGSLYATITQTTFCRGDGGFGGPPRTAPEPHTLPTRAPDAVCDLVTRPEMALLYRWNAACRSRDCEGGGVPAPDPARACDFRRLGACHSQDHVRLRSRPLQVDGGAVFLSGLSGRNDPYRDVA